MKVGKKCKWEDIEVGEVFANEGCWEVYYKISENKLLNLADDWAYSFGGQGLNYLVGVLMGDVYKLSKKVQALWKEE